ncbi:hypothetical protein K504DRAFT_366328 [Pleomassaria siparia CBS 279.74]|uniref:VASt domain-containing protein n=1 Tax=Pleomassaria siparia CBS 279.74 TaxID=1314801 RepID=A0A6G1KQM1_9PLEO|nr:hypothetical protein K504DRAFT_366328 [Pleomassaria siparia CBS 279.74]
MAAVEKVQSRSTLTSRASRENSLAPNDRRQTSKSGINSSTTSVVSSDPDTQDLRYLSDGIVDKYKSRGSDDGQSETSSHRRKISKLFKGRRKRSHQEDVPPLPNDPRFKTIESEAAPDPDPDPLFGSQESLGLHKSLPSSLFTDDSDAENYPVRPGISPHQSHTGYLTLSSPLIASETADAVAQSDATLIDPVTSASEANTLLRHSQTIDVGASRRRNPSPVGKLKEAFAPTRRSISPKSGLDAEGGRLGSSGGGSGLGSLFGARRQGSKVLDDTVVFQASPPQLHHGPETQSTPTLPSLAPKRIITQIPSTPPNLGAAPTTLVTPPTPTDAKPASPTGSTSSRSSAKNNSNVVVSPSGNMISHRRARSVTNPPSKLSNSISAPLTPTLEEVKTPGGTAGPPQSPTGFFSSVFSAAQNAANTLSTTIANTTATNKNKLGNQPIAEEKRTGDVGGEEVIGLGNADASTDNSGSERRLAVETLGSGNLSLAQLGIADSNNPSPMSSAPNLPMRSDEASAMAEDIAAAQAVNAAYAAENSAPASVVENRDRSLTTTSGGGMSPQRQQDVCDSPAAPSIGRQGSIRSRISGGRRRRHRGSSATTGHTIAAAIGASTSTLAPQAALNGQRLNGTGFAVAPSKRNRDFHNQFKSVPEDDYLIEDYSAALQKEILLHGRLYVSEGHLCFSSNILGWVTNLVISFDEVVSVEKKSTAVVFPNAIVITTLHARNVFASFLSRDPTYDLIIGIWKISHPNLKSSLNGVTLDGSGTGDKTEKAESVGSEDESTPDSDDEVYDEDAEEDEGMGSFTEAGEGSVAGSEHEPTVSETRKASALVAQAVSGGPIKLGDAAETVIKNADANQDFPGPKNHAPTDCGDADSHYDKPLIDTTIPAPLGKIYNLMFGPASGIFMRKWLSEDQRCTDLQMEDDKKGLGEERKTYNYSYIKPLPGSIGPRQTKCIIALTLEQFDLEKGVTVSASTQTPDVPSGSVFLTKTRYCLMWGPNNTTRLIMTFTVEWSGKSWLKGPIEKGASDGQLTYSTAIASALRTAVSTKALLKAPVGKGGKLRKRSKANGLNDSNATPASPEAGTAANSVAKKSGILEPVRGILPDILVDILELLLTAQSVMGILTVLLIYSWFFRSNGSGLSHGTFGPSPQRSIAYEEMWRTEESELWKWLEDRVALDRVHDAVNSGYNWQQEKNMQQNLGKDGVTGGMKDRQIDEAIRVTEERLKALKGAVKRNQEGGEERLRGANEK